MFYTANISMRYSHCGVMMRLPGVETSGCDRDFVTCNEAFLESDRGSVAALEGC